MITTHTSNMGIRLALPDGSSWHITNCYSPHSGHARNAHTTFTDALNDLWGHATPSDILLACGDFNRGLGNTTTNPSSTAGHFGLPRVDRLGRDFVPLLASHDLSCLCSRQQARPNRMATWFHPSTKVGFQLDRMFLPKKHFHLIKNPGTTSNIINSDHLPLRASILLDAKSKKKHVKRTPSNSKPRVVLQEDQIAQFRAEFLAQTKNLSVLLWFTGWVPPTSLQREHQRGFGTRGRIAAGEGGERRNRKQPATTQRIPRPPKDATRLPPSRRPSFKMLL